MKIGKTAIILCSSLCTAIICFAATEIFNIFDPVPTDPLSINVLPLNDMDLDGLPDSWERMFFGDLSRDGSGDFDQDTLSDLAEYHAGCDPSTTAIDDVTVQIVVTDHNFSLWDY